MKNVRIFMGGVLETVLPTHYQKGKEGAVEK